MGRGTDLFLEMRKTILKLFGKILWKSHKYVSTGEIAENHKKAGRPNTLTSRVTYHQQKKEV